MCVEVSACVCVLALTLKHTRACVIDANNYRSPGRWIATTWSMSLITASLVFRLELRAAAQKRFAIVAVEIVRQTCSVAQRQIVLPKAV